jgi:hypothetical protein
LALEPPSGDGVVLSFAAAVDGWLAGVSAGVDDTVGIGGSGTAATAPVELTSGLGVEGIEGVELDAVVLASGLEDGVTSGEGAMLVPAEPCASLSTLEAAGDERDADARVERLEVLLLALLFDAVFVAGALFTGGVVSAAGADTVASVRVGADAVASVRVGADAVASLRVGACDAVVLVSVSVAVVFATAGAEALGAGLRAFATTACRVADAVVFGVSLRL